MILNANIDNLKCLVRLSHFTKNPEDSNTYHKAYAFAVQSVAGKILTFHIMTDYGMLRSRVPISEIFLERESNGDIPADFKQLWDSFLVQVIIGNNAYIFRKTCQVVLKDKKLIWATYLFTVDWYRNGYSDEPSDYKCGHILVADEGYLLCQPNNRIFWKDSNWVTKTFPEDLKATIKVDDDLISVETASDRWVSADANSFYYEIKSAE